MAMAAAAATFMERVEPYCSMRTALWQAQTPQLFQTALLLRALCAADSDGFTDEASAVEALGIRPQLVEGDARNLKLTLPQDETLVRLLLAAV